MTDARRPGWYPDPWGTDDDRYFDGAAWTQSVRATGGPLLDAPLDSPVDARGASPTGVPTVAPAGAGDAPAAVPASAPTPQLPPSAGWFPDPWRVAPMRWWDGSQWTGYTSASAWDAGASGGFNDPGASTVGSLVDSERVPARRARASLLLAGPAQAVVTVAGAFQAQWYADHWSELWHAAQTSGSTYPTSDLGSVGVLGQVGAIVLLVTAIAFLIWFYRAAATSAASGIPARRSPLWGTFTFIVPIVNLWFPYQSTRDLFPIGHPARRSVARWWALFVPINVGGLVLLVSAFVSSAVTVALAIVIAGLAVPAAFAGRDVVAHALELHESYASASIG